MTNNNQKEAWFPGWKKQTGGDLQPVNVREGWAAIGQYDSYQDNVTAYKEALNASIGGLPLKYAELADDPAFAMNPMTGRWARTSAGESEVLFYDAHGAFGSGRTGTPISRMLMTDESDLNFTGFKTINNSPAYKNGYIARRN